MVFKVTTPIRRKQKQNMPTQNEYKKNYNEVMNEFATDVEYRIKNAYVLVKDENDFLAKLYTNTTNEEWREHNRTFTEYEEWGEHNRPLTLTEYEEWECEQVSEYYKTYYSNQKIKNQYHEMLRYDSIDAFLTEHIKNSICEDNLGDIISFL